MAIQKIDVWGVRVSPNDSMQSRIPNEPQVWIFDDCPCDPHYYLRTADGGLFYLGPVETNVSYFLALKEGKSAMKFPPLDQLRVLEIIIPSFPRAN